MIAAVVAEGGGGSAGGRFARTVGALLLLAGCSTSMDEPTPLSFGLVVDQAVVAVGTEVTFQYRATGPDLIRILLRYGDGAADSVVGFRGEIAGGRFMHAYAASGTYEAVGTAFDSDNGRVSASVTIQVTGSDS